MPKERLRWGLATLFALTLNVAIGADDKATQIAEYDYPFDDPLVATVVGTPSDWQEKFPQKPPSEQLQLDALIKRSAPEVFWYQEGLRYSLAAQPHAAAMVFVIAGTGAGFDSAKMKVLESALYNDGFHVVSLSSPTYANFIVSASETGVPGHMSNDAADLYRAMIEIRNRHQAKLKISGYALTGYSLGAANAAYVAHLDEKEKEFDFQRVMLINPPVSLFNSVNLIDGLLAKNLSTDPASVDQFIGEVFDELAEIQQSDDPIDMSGDALYKVYNHAHPGDRALGALIGISFRTSSANMLFTADVVTDQGYLKPAGLTLGSADSLTSYLKASTRITFLEYFDEFFLPYYQKRDPQITRQNLLDSLSLKPLEAYLINASKVFMVTNRDDLILADGEVEYLESTFGARARIFPSGGHCGNLAHPVFLSHITDTMRLQQ